VPGQLEQSTGSLRDAVAQALDRLRLVPGRYRRFDESVDQPDSVFRLPPDVVRILVEVGFPHRVDGGVVRFDRLDLENISMLLNVPSLKGTTMRLWSGALTDLVPAPEVSYRLRIAARCPERGHPGACDFRLAPWASGGEGVREVRSRVPGDYELTLTLPADEHLFGPQWTDVVDRVRALSFCYLPPELGRDLAFVAETGLADCRLATHYLVEMGRAAGLPMRKAAGLFLGYPLAMRHNWVEFHDGGRWLPADPLTLQLLADWQAVDPAVWPPHRALLGVLWSVDRDAFFDTRIITHGTGRIRPAIRVRKLTGAVA
jgi:hypothetical protein